MINNFSNSIVDVEMDNYLEKQFKILFKITVHVDQSVKYFVPIARAIQI